MPLVSGVAAAAQQIDQTDYAPGLIAFLVIFALAITCWLLFRSMTKHIRRANQNAPAAGDGSAGGRQSGAASANDAADATTAGSGSE